MFNPTAAAAYLGAWDPVRRVDGFKMSEAGLALAAIPEKNAIAQAGLASIGLKEAGDTQRRRDEIEYYKSAQDTLNKRNLLSGLMEGFGFAGGGPLARAQQLGLKLPSTSSSANELAQWQALANQYRQNMRNMTTEGVGGSWSMVGAGLKKLQS